MSKHPSAPRQAAGDNAPQSLSGLEYAVGIVIGGLFNFGLGWYWIRHQRALLQADIPSIILKYNAEPSDRDPLALICVIKGIRVVYCPSDITQPSPVLIIQSPGRNRTILELDEIKHVLHQICLTETHLIVSEDQFAQRSYSYQALVRHIEGISGRLAVALATTYLQSFAYEESDNFLALDRHAVEHSTRQADTGDFCTLEGDSLTLADTLLCKCIFDAKQALPDQSFMPMIRQVRNLRAIREHVSSYAHIVPSRPTCSCHAVLC